MRRWALFPVSGWPTVVAAVLAAAMGALVRWERGPGGNVWDQLLGVAGNPYLVVYLLLPLSLVVAHRRGEVLGEPGLRLRYGSPLRWLVAVGSDSLRQVAPLSAVVMAAAVATSAGMVVATGWSALMLAEVPAPPAPPWLLTALAPVAWGVGLAVAMSVVVAAGTRGRSVGLGAAGLLWVLVVVGFQTDVPGVRLLSAPFRLPGAVIDDGGLAGGLLAVAVAVAVLLVVAAVLAGAGAEVWAAARTQRHLDLLVLTAVTVAATAAMVAVHPDGTALERVWAVFAGSAPWQLQVLPYLYQVIVLLGPAYVVLLRLEHELDNDFVNLALRHGSARRWWRRRMLGWVRWGAWPLLPYTLVVAALAAGGQLVVLDAAWLATAYHLLVNSALQLWVAILVVAGARWYSGRAEHALGALGALVVLGAFRVPPAGLSGASWLISEAAGVDADDPAAVLALDVGGFVTASVILPVLVVALVTALLATVDKRGQP